MRPSTGYEELARQTVPVARRYGVPFLSLMPPGPGLIYDEEGRLHLLLNLDGVSSQPDFDRLTYDLEQATGHRVELYTLESVRHSVYSKNVIRESIILTMPD